MPNTPAKSSPFPARFYAYLLERFPPLNGLMFFILFATAYILSPYFAAPNQPVSFGLSFFAGFLAVYCFFFRLRVFDEHKDYEKDCIYHPQRVLQSGLISLNNLKVVAFIGLMLEAGISLWFSPTVFLWWLVAFVYSLLMAKEFFVSRWLEPRLVLYALSHMLIMPVMVLWMCSMALTEGAIPSQLYILCLLCFFSGMAFEICRKIKAPEDEVDGVPTYSQILGIRGATNAALTCLIVSALLLSYLLYKIDGPGLLALVFLLLLACSTLFQKFVKDPTPANAKKLELGSSVFMLVAYILPIASTLYNTGVRWH
jgi:4-hydroxybenzoate polyprenyltransferase